MSTLRFHEKVFNLSGENPIFSQTANSAILAREQLLGITFPAAFKEWYSLENSAEIFQNYLENGHLFNITQLNLISAQVNYQTPYIGIIPFYKDFESASEYAILLDGSENPPVVCSNEEGTDWEICYSELSDFLYVTLWDVLYLKLPYILITHRNEPTQADLALLRASFKEIYPELTEAGIYRFESENQHLKIYCYGKEFEGYEGKADWWFEANSSNALYDLLAKCGECASLTQESYLRLSPFRDTKESNAVADKVRIALVERGRL